jgi:hypothetical protein
VLALGCGDGIGGDSGNEDAADSNDDGDQDGSDDGGDDEACGAGFVCGPDQQGGAMCDIWNPNDCPEGEKCMPYAATSGTWDALKCSPLDEDPAPIGDECQAPDGVTAGIDNCEKGAYCYYIHGPEKTGVCIPFCTGDPQNPTCPPEYLCSIVNDGVLVICRPDCDPVLQDCELPGTTCLEATGSPGFVCILDASGQGGLYQDECQYLNACAPGFFCSPADTVPGCGSNQGCCTNFCDVTEPNECPGAAQGQECVAWFEDPVPGYDHVGGCVIPE